MVKKHDTSLMSIGTRIGWATLTIVFGALFLLRFRNFTPDALMFIALMWCITRMLADGIRALGDFIARENRDKEDE